MPKFLPLLQEELGARWKELPEEIREGMLQTQAYASKLLMREIAGRSAVRDWKHVKAQTSAWVAGGLAGAETAWWIAMQRWAGMLGVALWEGFVVAAEAALREALPE